ncbi:hypothetical protein P4055_10735 [Pseudomonas aeruginosa]|nr:hypothetical protein [Pseudomonas aeruginosa]
MSSYDLPSAVVRLGDVQHLARLGHHQPRQRHRRRFQDPDLVLLGITPFFLLS